MSLNIRASRRGYGIGIVILALWLFGGVEPTESGESTTPTAAPATTRRPAARVEIVAAGDRLADRPTLLLKRVTTPEFDDLWGTTDAVVADTSTVVPTTPAETTMPPLCAGSHGEPIHTRGDGIVKRDAPPPLPYLQYPGAASNTSAEDEEFGKVVVQSSMHGLQPVMWTLNPPAESSEGSTPGPELQKGRTSTEKGPTESPDVSLGQDTTVGVLTGSSTEPGPHAESQQKNDPTEGSGGRRPAHFDENFEKDWNWRTGFSDPILGTDFLHEMHKHDEEDRMRRTLSHKRHLEQLKQRQNTAKGAQTGEDLADQDPQGSTGLDEPQSDSTVANSTEGSTTVDPLYTLPTITLQMFVQDTDETTVASDKTETTDPSTTVAEATSTTTVPSIDHAKTTAERTPSGGPDENGTTSTGTTVPGPDQDGTEAGTTVTASDEESTVAASLLEERRRAKSYELNAGEEEEHRDGNSMLENVGDMGMADKEGPNATEPTEPTVMAQESQDGANKTDDAISLDKTTVDVPEESGTGTTTTAEFSDPDGTTTIAPQEEQDHETGTAADSTADPKIGTTESPKFEEPTTRTTGTVSTELGITDEIEGFETGPTPTQSSGAKPTEVEGSSPTRTTRAISTRATQTEANLDPNRPADPSLAAVTLAHPDYRRVSTSTPRSEPDPAGGSERTSATIMQMGGVSDELGDETPAPGPGAVTEETTIIEDRPTVAGEAATESSTVITTVINEADRSSTTVTESEATTVTPLRDESNEEGFGTGTVITDDRTADFLGVLRKALRDDDASRIKFQNLTIVLPHFNPPPRALFDAVGTPGGVPQRPPAYPPLQYPPRYPQGTMGAQQNRVLYDSRGYGNPNVGYGLDRSTWTRMEPPATFSGDAARVRREDVLINAQALNGLMKSQKRLRVLDATYEPDGSAMISQDFQNFPYAKWDKLMSEKRSAQYEQSHIPGAIHFNLNIATHPTWNDRQALYPADLFEEYVRRLGINSGDDIVVYARGPMGGMLHAARVWALFRIYGHERIRVLDGGFRAWRKAFLPTTVPRQSKTDSEEEQTRKQRILGNWAAFFNSALTVTYEELTIVQSDGYCVLSRLVWYNFLDARPRNEFLGFTGSQQYSSVGSRMPNTKPFPADELVDAASGQMVSSADIEQKLNAIGYNRAHQTIVAGNTADEASLVVLALKLVGENTAKLYNGGIEELRKRAPQIFTEK